MALATLNGAPVPGMIPPWTLTLSHKSSLDSALPKEPLCAQFVKFSSGSHPLQRATAQEIFRWFRPAGPLVLVQTGVDVGYPNEIPVIQYWHEEHALRAHHEPRKLSPVLSTMPPFTLRTIAQWCILASVSNVKFATLGVN